MKTDQIIELIAADTVPEPAPAKLLPRALLVTAAVVGAAFLLACGARADTEALWMHWNVAVKQLFPVILAVGGFGAVLRLSRPGATVGRWIAPLLAVPALLAVAVGLEMWLVPPSGWKAAMMGETHLFCLTVIPLMSLPILGASLWALRQGASTRPWLSGALAGLMSGGTATALYAIHCIEDSPLFYATWYGLGILAVTGVGALVGRRVLAW